MLFLCGRPRNMEKAGEIINFIHLWLFVLHYMKQMFVSQHIKLFSLTLISVPRPYFKCKYDVVIMQSYVSVACLINQHC